MTAVQADDKTMLARLISKECSRAGLTYEKVRLICTGAASTGLCAEYALHKARAKQVLDNMRRAKQ